MLTSESKTMALTHSSFYFSFLSIFSVIFIVQSKSILLPPHHEALLNILKELGIKGKKYDPIIHSQCIIVEILCDWAMLNKGYSLRVTHNDFKFHQLINGVQRNPRSSNGQIPPQIIHSHKLEISDDLRKNRLLGTSRYESLSFPLANKVISCRFLNISWNRVRKGPSSKLRRIDASSKSRSKNSKRYIFLENWTTESQSHVRAPARDAQPPSITTEQPQNHHQHKRKKIQAWIFWVGILAGGLTGLTFSVSLSLVMLRRIKRNRVAKYPRSVTTFRELHPMKLAFLLEEDNLKSLGEFIGKGGCGEVYAVELPAAGFKVAVKKIKEPYKSTRELTEENDTLLDKKMRQIKREIQIVGLIRHRNLLPLLAHLPRPRYHYLVYPYIKNGSLEDVICEVSTGKRTLDWLSRHRIALGIARGLKYMHMDISPRIIHRDLKPANILLDDEMEAKITDFGLSKAFPEINTHLMSHVVAGTAGYIAPEYHETLMFSDKSDIYSFGVILAALVMGKLPADEFFQRTDEANMVKWVRNIVSANESWRAIDASLLGKGYELLMLSVLQIACDCTSDEPKERPNSRDVVIMLESYFPHQSVNEASKGKISLLANQ